MRIAYCVHVISYVTIFCSLVHLVTSLSFYLSGKPRTVKNCGISNVPSERIVGGTPAVHGQYPWIVSLHYDFFGFQHMCGGAILNENWIVTAAHCLDSKEVSDYQIHVGIHQLSNKTVISARSYEVSKIIVHEGYVTGSFDHDIALMRTRQPIDIKGSNGYVNGICLPKRPQEDPSGWSVVAGWGMTEEEGEISDILNEVDIPLIPRPKCAKAYKQDEDKSGITFSMICAGMVNKDSCQSDSGGPLMQMDRNGVFTLIGVVSHGQGCGRKHFPGVYTKVSSYLAWLEKNMRETDAKFGLRN